MMSVVTTPTGISLISAAGVSASATMTSASSSSSAASSVP
jgi:hypothetical protein